MSTWIGKPGDRLSVRDAQTMLADAARAAARPSWIWLAGFFYPSVLVVPAVGVRAAQTGLGETWEALLAWTLTPLFVPPIVLLVAGLARLASPRNWSERVAQHGRLRLRDAWTAGRGLFGATLGLWLCLLLLDLVVLGIGLIVFRSLGGHEDWRAYVFGGPLLLFCCVYAVVVSVLFQLALQSLAQNQRGVASAIQHSWRLTQNDSWATLRAALVDCALSAALAGLSFLVSFGGTWNFAPLSLAYLVLTAIAGVARALYWARVYRALGGLTPEDGVPGLATATPAVAPPG